MEQNFFGEMTLQEVLEKLPPEYLDFVRERQACRERDRKVARVFKKNSERGGSIGTRVGTGTRRRPCKPTGQRHSWFVSPQNS